MEDSAPSVDSFVGGGEDWGDDHEENEDEE